MAEREDQLFKLIKSLTKAQKRYIKVNATHIIGKQNNYMLLFDALDKMDSYDESKLLKKFKGTNFIKHLPSEKNYLFELILKNMRSFNNDRNINFTIQSLIQDIFFLYEKGMLESSLKKIRKAKKLCYNFGQYYYLLEILQWERRITNLHITNEYIVNNGEKHQEINHVIQLIDNEHTYQKLKDEFNLLFRRDFYNVEEEKLQKLEELFKHPALQDQKLALTFRAKLHFHSCYVTYYRVKSIRKKELEAERKTIELWEANPHLISEYLYHYKTILHSYAETAYAINAFDLYSETIAKMKSIPANSIKEEAEDFQNIYFLELYYYLNSGNFDKALELVPEISDSLLKYNELINKPRLISFYYNIAVVYFIHEAYEETLEWINRISLIKLDTRQDLQHLARIMQLILHYETSPPEVVEYIYGQTYRYLYKHDRINQFEKIVFTYIRKLNKVVDRPKMLGLLGDLLEELNALKIEKPNTIGLEELIIWIINKRDKIPIKDILQERLEAEVQNTGK